jgi:hypothetical protein
MNRVSLAAAMLGALLLGGLTAHAQIATISGSYDLLQADTPALTFHNSSAFDFTGAQMVLHGYQGLNDGITQTVGLPDILHGTDYNYIWNGAFTPGNLTSYDYDDSYGYPTPMQVGNFSVTFTAMWDGMPIYSQFSPTTNATGGFVGWEGLTPAGVSEDYTYDAHQGSVTGTLAYIYEGTPPPIPEPSSLALAGIGLIGGATVAYRRRRQNGKV